jgi:D-sedoheptulose 7-phosphate isomerase
MQEQIKSEFKKLAAYFIEMQTLAPIITEAAKLCIGAIQNGNKIFFCGNGGSAADAQHLAAELVGRYKLERPSIPAIALTVDTSVITSIANDYGFETVFSRQLDGLGQPGDVLYAISTSGTSKNIIAAIVAAKKKHMAVIALTGKTGGAIKELSDISICVPASSPNSVQELHIAVGHLICDFIEQATQTHE